MFWTEEVIRAEHSYRRQALLHAARGGPGVTGTTTRAGLPQVWAALRRLATPPGTARHAVVK